MSFLPFFLILISSILQGHAFAAKKSYVVYIGGHSNHENKLLAQSDEHVRQTHLTLLRSHLKSEEKAKDAIFYSYTRHINGFAAILDEEVALAISNSPGVISVFENKVHKLHTTHSWQFLGLEGNGEIPRESLWTKARFGEDVIIGNIDTGVWPESESFRDENMGPIPSRWKGICQKGNDTKFSCNRKLIGARYFFKGFEAAVGTLSPDIGSPRDRVGHGTHTLSTAGGSPVPGANVLGFGNGTAKGGSPRARVAAYKACWPYEDSVGCLDADILAAFDAAIHDGVDVLSISIGKEYTGYCENGVAVGAFHAISKGISVVASAGNSGPKPGTVVNVAPWLLTVGASTIDRQFPAYAIFGEHRLQGESLSNASLPRNKMLPLISSSDAAAANASNEDAKLCKRGSLDATKVKGKIVVCVRGDNFLMEKGEVVKLAGGEGMILVNNFFNGDEIFAELHLLPATHISYSDGAKLFSYLDSTKSPMGSITYPFTKLGTKPAPLVASFSSQGPNTVTPEILKPDIIAPGVNIIAAYTKVSSLNDFQFDERRLPFNFESGTSMSCPHIAGIVGLLKALHPEWSPSAIKSAIMTTASSLDNTEEPIKSSLLAKANPFSYGSGHIWPSRAMDPGLVYDLNITDYLDFLCTIGYNSSQISSFKPYKCPSNLTSLMDLNYPSITVPSLNESVTIVRRLKNVGSPGMYVAKVQNPVGVVVSINPERIAFEKVGEEKKFEVKLVPKGGSEANDYVFGSLEWSDGKHNVRSPITVKLKGH